MKSLRVTIEEETIEDYTLLSVLSQCFTKQIGYFYSMVSYDNGS